MNPCVSCLCCLEIMNDYPGIFGCKRLFVGQIPKSWSDSDLKELFNNFGEVVEATVIVDKYTGIPKGCGFVSFSNDESVIIAQRELHGNKILEGMLYPMYVKPADVGGITGKKIFVGMIGKLTTKNDLFRIFSKYGPIEDITILRTPHGTPKGCAFVKFFNRLDANLAITKTHNKYTLPGCYAPIVVRIAETEHEKLLKKFKSAIWAITTLMENGTMFDKFDPRKIMSEKINFDTKTQNDQQSPNSDMEFLRKSLAQVKMQKNGRNTVSHQFVQSLRNHLQFHKCGEIQSLNDPHFM